MQLTSVLRYVGIVPADRAFFEAGLAWKDAGRPNMAFVLLNRFLDLCDAMDDPDSSAAVLENSDFADTDIPFDFHIPQRAYVAEEGREDVSGGPPVIPPPDTRHPFTCLVTPILHSPPVAPSGLPVVAPRDPDLSGLSLMASL